MKMVSREDGLAWQLAEVQLELDQDESRKTAARNVLRLSDLLAVAPTSVRAWRLLARSYAQRGQPDKSAEALTDAISRGLDVADFRIAITEFYADSQPAQAKTHAAAAFRASDSTPEIRRQAVDVLLRAKSFRTAHQLLASELPDPIRDTDQHFAIISTLAITSQTASERAPLRGIIAQHGQSDRWFDLCIDVARRDDLKLAEAREWLTTAETLIEASPKKRRRRTSSAWRGIAARKQSRECWQEALRVLRPVAKNSPETTDWISIPHADGPARGPEEVGAGRTDSAERS